MGLGDQPDTGDKRWRCYYCNEVTGMYGHFPNGCPTKTPKTKYYWADNLDVLEGLHEADIGIVATCADAKTATLVAKLLNNEAKGSA
jgi:hypothetical protein